MSWPRPWRPVWGALACDGLMMDWELLAAWVEPQDSPMAPAAEVTPTDMGMLGRAQKTPPAFDPLRPWGIPFSGTGVLARGTANAGAATPAVRMAAEAAPPRTIRQLNTEHSNVEVGSKTAASGRIWAWPGKKGIRRTGDEPSPDHSTLCVID
jgi:hypothetical protein